ncbi:hypothetical protein BDQ17DRAFT_1438364 [Cyathus striatus]|nr:hypothetical protein BDQ17DRAFT_1438364 [Cyathus striatus]
MDILEKHYPNEDHVLIFDNATTHQKCPDGSLAALKMPKNPSDNFFVEVSVHDLETGKLVYAPDGKPLKNRVHMSNGYFKDGKEQEFYFPEGHDLGGKFKGMQNILEECGYDISGKKAQCGKKFSDCPDGMTTCCC